MKMVYDASVFRSLAINWECAMRSFERIVPLLP